MCVCIYIYIYSIIYYIIIYIILYEMCVVCDIIQTFCKIMGYSSLCTSGFNLFYKGDCLKKIHICNDVRVLTVLVM